MNSSSAEPGYVSGAHVTSRRSLVWHADCNLPVSFLEGDRQNPSEAEMLFRAWRAALDEEGRI